MMEAVGTCTARGIAGQGAVHFALKLTYTAELKNLPQEVLETSPELAHDKEKMENYSRVEERPFTTLYMQVFSNVASDD